MTMRNLEKIVIALIIQLKKERFRGLFIGRIKDVFSLEVMFI